MLIRRKKQIGTGGSLVTPYAKALVNKVLNSGRFSYGPFLREFEKKFAQMHERKFSVASSSGTSALYVALHALKELDGWQDGDEVLVPAMTFIATSNVIIQNGLKPVFVDVDPKFYNIDPEKIEEKITARTRAIMPVHLFGLSAEMNEIMRIAKRHNLRVVEDSCETAGVNYRGRPVGSLGDIACFSTYMAHLVTTGVGGLALTNDPKIAVKMRSLVNHGRDSIYISMDDDKGKSGKALAEVISRRFSFVSVGHSHRITEMEGALGVAQLKALPANIKLRNKYASYLMKSLKPYERFLQLPSWPKHSEHAFMMFPLVVINKKISYEKLMHHLESWNIETRTMFPILSQPVYLKIFGDLRPQYPIATFLNENGFFVGCHPEMTKEDVKYIIDVFEEFFRGHHA